MKNMFLKSLSTFFFIFLINIYFSFGQNTLEKFGKNRVQYKRYYWRNLSTANFDVYYYDNGSRLANFATRFLEVEFDKITEILGYTPYAKAKIFVYNSTSDLQQSNVGIDANSVIVGGQTEFFKSLVEIPFTGSEVDFKRELRLGVAQMLVREMMFGGSLKDMVQSSYIGNFSEWFLLGAAAYVADGWTEEMDDHIRDMFRGKKTKKPNLLTGKDAVFAGQSFWNFIAERYGTGNISNILNLARIIRNEKNSITSTIGIRYQKLLTEWQSYYKTMSEEISDNAEEPQIDFRLRKKNRKNLTFNELTFSPDGNKIAYSENANGKYRVVIKDVRTRKRKVILRRGYNAIHQRYDNNIPLLSWRDNNNLGVMFSHKGETRLEVYNPRKKLQFQRIWFYFNHVSGFDFSDDGNFLALSADRKGEIDFKTGQNDIYIFGIEESNLKQITDDWFDDINPSFLPNSNEAFIFSSNRTDDTLSTNLIKDRGNYQEELNNFDIFMYQPLQSPTVLFRLSNSPYNDLNPKLLDANTILYLNEDNGILQLKKYDLQKGKSQTLTNYKQSIRNFDVNSQDNEFAFLMIRKGKYYPNFRRNLDLNLDLKPNFQTTRLKTLAEKSPALRVVIPDNPPVNLVDSSLINPNEKTENYDPDEVDTDNYQFDSEIVKEKQSGLDKAQDEMLNTVKRANEDEIKVKGPYDYQHRFRTENVTTSVAIDPLRGWGILMNATTSDLLENHKIKGGFFLLTDLRSSDFFGEYQYLPRRLDYGIRYDRKGIFINTGEVTQRYTLNKFQFTISYPITNLSRISVSPFYTNTLWTSLDFLTALDHKLHYSGGRVEYVFDNTVLNGQNMISGMRIKIYYENYRTLLFNKGFKNQIAEPFDVKAKDLNFDKISVDFRRYEPIHKDLILATRIAYGRFGGKSPKNFLVGGMDNWFFNQTDGGGDNNPLATANNFDNSDLLFNEFITNLRGYNYNKIAGQNFFIANVELRFPIIKYLFGKRINNNFFKNLQFVGFYDFGSAWTGISPFNRENSINTRNVGSPQSPFDATVNDFKNPWLAGYGLGLRSMLLGYYLKFDAAWAIEDYIIAKKPKLYLTFGYDF